MVGAALTSAAVAEAVVATPAATIATVEAQAVPVILQELTLRIRMAIKVVTVRLSSPTRR